MCSVWIKVLMMLLGHLSDFKVVPAGVTRPNADRLHLQLQLRQHQEESWAPSVIGESPASSSSSSAAAAAAEAAAGDAHAGVKTRDLFNALHPPPPSERPGPYFDPANVVSVLSVPQASVTLHCKVQQRGNYTVSWVRHKDLSVLTVGRYTYVSDLRFSALHDQVHEDWKLHIDRPGVHDSGVYECQISTTPPMSLQFNLTVLRAETELVGGPDIYVAKGSTINLTCLIKNTLLPPEAVTWYHNNKVIDYKSPRGGVSVATDKGATSSSTLVLLFARASDSGEYRCEPSNGVPAVGKIHVLNGEYQAPMQSGIGMRCRMELQVVLALGAVLRKLVS